MAMGNMIWVDMEFTGLDADRDVILEVAAVITDWRLEVVQEGPSIAIHQSDRTLEAMDEWNRTHHLESGLIERVKRSAHTLDSAQDALLEFLKVHCIPQDSPMCGNSIHVDRMFMRRYMPLLHDFFHYRNVDVSTVKELARRWRPDLPEFKKAKSHRALDDIMESIGELRYYRGNLFRL
jgi:oligoribonuclease